MGDTHSNPKLKCSTGKIVCVHTKGQWRKLPTCTICSCDWMWVGSTLSPFLEFTRPFLGYKSFSFPSSRMNVWNGVGENTPKVFFCAISIYRYTLTPIRFIGISQWTMYILIIWAKFVCLITQRLFIFLLTFCAFVLFRRIFGQLTHSHVRSFYSSFDLPIILLIHSLNNGINKSNDHGITLECQLLPNEQNIQYGNGIVQTNKWSASALRIDIQKKCVSWSGEKTLTTKDNIASPIGSWHGRCIYNFLWPWPFIRSKHIIFFCIRRTTRIETYRAELKLITTFFQYILLIDCVDRWRVGHDMHVKWKLENYKKKHQRPNLPI